MWTLVTMVVVAVLAGPALGWTEQWPHVYGGSHFDEVVKAQDGTARYNVVLFIYKPNCPAKIDVHSLPQDQYVMLMTYDRITEPKAVWWQADQDENLYYRYGKKKKDCQMAVFFMKDRPLDEFVTWNPLVELDFVAWVWSFVAVPVTVYNLLDRNVAVKQEGYRYSPEFEDAIIAPGATEVYISYPGYILSFSAHPAGKEIAKFYVIDEMNITIAEYMKLQNITQVRNKAIAKNAEVQTWMFNNAMHKLIMMRQPLFVHAHTNTGYRKAPLDKALYDSIMGYYDANIISKHQIHMKPLDMHFLNPYHMDMELVGLSVEFANGFAESIRQQAMAWCNCGLQYTMAYGIWDFGKGAQFNMHVDLMSYRVISAMIVLDKFLDEQPDWKMKIITYDGESKFFKFQPGDMFLFEAARIPHGWPEPFQGESYVVAFFHFYPTQNWPYTLYERTYHNSHTQKKLPLETESSIQKRDKYPYQKAKKTKPNQKATAANPEPVFQELQKKKEAEQEEKRKEADRRIQEFKMKKGAGQFEYKLSTKKGGEL